MNNHDSLFTVRIKQRAGKRAKRGHPWLFSNEVEHPKPAPQAGEAVRIEDEKGSFFGYGTYNPHCLVSVRIFSRREDQDPFTAAWMSERIVQAAALRNRLYPQRQAFRLLYGESDGVPGVVGDWYDGTLVLQIASAGMERLLPIFLDACQQTLRPQAIVLANDSEKRQLEDLPRYRRVAAGELITPLVIHEYGVQFEADPLLGQKTGHFFDQAENRLALTPFAPQARVLDLFGYTGAWSLQMLKHGAACSTVVDSSATAIEWLQANALLNGLADAVEPVEADAFAWLREARQRDERFDLVISDPPAFAKASKQSEKAKRGYEDLHRQAIHLVAEGGLLCACSCSYFLSQDDFLGTLQRAASRE